MAKRILRKKGIRYPENAGDNDFYMLIDRADDSRYQEFLVDLMDGQDAQTQKKLQDGKKLSRSELESNAKNVAFARRKLFIEFVTIHNFDNPDGSPVSMDDAWRFLAPEEKTDVHDVITGGLTDDQKKALNSTVSSFSTTSE